MTQFELAAKDALKLFLTSQGNTDIGSSTISDFQVILRSSQIPLSLRHLTADHVNKLIKVKELTQRLKQFLCLSCLLKVPGIVIKCSEISSKAITVGVSCSKCGHTKILSARDPLQSVSIPNKCDNSATSECGLQTYEIDVDQCDYVDQQKLKLQESPEVVPTGEMPRNIMAVVDK